MLNYGQTVEQVNAITIFQPVLILWLLLILETFSGSFSFRSPVHSLPLAVVHGNSQSSLLMAARPTNRPAPQKVMEVELKRRM